MTPITDWLAATFTVENLTIVAAAVAVVASIPLLGYALVSGRTGDRRQKTPADDGLSEFRRRQLSSSFTDRLAAPLLQDVAHYARRVTPRGVVNGAVHKLVVAGIQHRMAIEIFLASKLLVAVGMATAVIVFGGALEGTTRLLAIAGAAVFGFVLPDAHLNRQAADRQEEIRNALPEALDQLSVVVETGLGFDAALNRLVETSTGPLTDEFARSLHAVRLGDSRSDALQQIADRTDVAEVRQFVAAVKQADSLGVPMARIVRTQADHVRTLKRLSVEEEAMRLPIKMTLPLVFCMLPALFVVLLGPVALRVMQSF